MFVKKLYHHTYYIPLQKHNYLSLSLSLSLSLFSFNHETYKLLISQKHKMIQTNLTHIKLSNKGKQKDELQEIIIEKGKRGDIILERNSG